MGSMIRVKSRRESGISAANTNATALMHWPLMSGSHIFRGGTHRRQRATVHPTYQKAFTTPTSLTAMWNLRSTANTRL